MEGWPGTRLKAEESTSRKRRLVRQLGRDEVRRCRRRGSECGVETRGRESQEGNHGQGGGEPGRSRQEGNREEKTKEEERKQEAEGQRRQKRCRAGVWGNGVRPQPRREAAGHSYSQEGQEEVEEKEEEIL